MLYTIDKVLDTRRCEPATMMVSKIKTSTMQLILQSTFNCADGDERGHTDARGRPSTSWWRRAGTA